MSWVNTLYNTQWFTELSLEDQQLVLCSVNIDGPVPVAEFKENRLVMEPNKQQCLLNQTSIIGLEKNFQKLYTLLMGEEGQGGLFGRMDKIENVLNTVVQKVADLPRELSHEISEAHGRIDKTQRDVDSIAIITRENRERLAELENLLKRNEVDNTTRRNLPWQKVLNILFLILSLSGIIFFVIKIWDIYG